MKVLLITDESLAEAWEPFALFKTQIGLPTEIVSVQWITGQYDGEDTQASIRACVLDYIETYGVRFIILGGDSGPNGTGLVPDRDTPHPQMGYRDIPTDLYYLSPGESDWDANDDGVYGDWRSDMEAVRYGHPSGASLGRIPVRTAKDIAAYTEKVIAYETRYPQDAFATHMLYTNTVDGSEPKVRRSWDDYISTAWDGGAVLRFFHTETSWDENRRGDYTLTARHWREKINARLAGKMHMHGHGMPGFWVLEDDGGHTLADTRAVARLSNEDAYLVMTTVSCFTGMYDAEEDPTIVEAMLRAPNKGAVSIIAPSREGVPIFHNPRRDFRLMVEEGKLDGTTETMTRFWMHGLSPRDDGTYRRIGEAFAQMKADMAVHAVKTPGYHWCQCELNLLGDPTLDLRAKVPVTPEVKVVSQRSEAVDGGQWQMLVAVDSGLSQTAGVTACFWQPGGAYVVVPVREDGTAQAELLVNREGELHITIAGANVNARALTLAPAEWMSP